MLLLRRHGVLRPRRNGLVVLQRFLRQLNRFFELRVMTPDDEIGPLRHDVIGIDAVLLDNPLSAIVRAPKPEARCGNKTTIPYRLHVADADQPAPRPPAANRPAFLPASTPS